MFGDLKINYSGNHPVGLASRLGYACTYRYKCTINAMHSYQNISNVLIGDPYLDKLLNFNLTPVFPAIKYTLFVYTYNYIQLSLNLHTCQMMLHLFELTVELLIRLPILLSYDQPC